MAVPSCAAACNSCVFLCVVLRIVGSTAEQSLCTVVRTCSTSGYKATAQTNRPNNLLGSINKKCI